MNYDEYGFPIFDDDYENTDTIPVPEKKEEPTVDIKKKGKLEPLF